MLRGHLGQGPKWPGGDLSPLQWPARWCRLMHDQFRGHLGMWSQVARWRLQSPVQRQAQWYRLMHIRKGGSWVPSVVTVWWYMVHPYSRGHPVLHVSVHCSLLFPLVAHAFVEGALGRWPRVVKVKAAVLDRLMHIQEGTLLHIRLFILFAVPLLVPSLEWVVETVVLSSQVDTWCGARSHSSATADSTGSGI